MLWLWVALRLNEKVSSKTVDNIKSSFSSVLFMNLWMWRLEDVWIIYWLLEKFQERDLVGQIKFDTLILFPFCSTPMYLVTGIWYKCLICPVQPYLWSSADFWTTTLSWADCIFAQCWWSWLKDVKSSVYENLNLESFLTLLQPHREKSFVLNFLFGK